MQRKLIEKIITFIVITMMTGFVYGYRDIAVIQQKIEFGETILQSFVKRFDKMENNINKILNQQRESR